MRVVAVVLLVCLSAMVEAKTKISGLERADFEAMRVKELKSLLKERKKTCAGCAEKIEFVNMLLELAANEVSGETEEGDKNEDLDVGSVPDPSSSKEALKNMMNDKFGGFDQMKTLVDSMGGPKGLASTIKTMGGPDKMISMLESMGMGDMIQQMGGKAGVMLALKMMENMDTIPDFVKDEL